ncbi:cyanobactin maturation protease PatG family protein [Amycolatopsis alkalitolerans]|nr:S8 family serine peptidase [Amycolatopsis alkalitolerans]
MYVRSVLAGLPVPGDLLLGDADVCIAVIDGPADLSHPCFDGADLTRIDTLVREPAGGGPMSVHGTHVTSLLFGQPGSPQEGLAPRCRGLVLPVFRDGADVEDTRASQLDLARAIERALQEGAHVINISGGERTPDGQADSLLARALRQCEDNGVLVVAATGNDGCECVQVPAAVPSVLAVGAAGENGEPLEASNWGQAYLRNGILAPGAGMLGAVPGGGVRALTGSSFATPVVSGIAALLLASELRHGQKPDPAKIGRLLLDAATPCDPAKSPECERHLVGDLAVARAYDHVTRGRNTAVTNTDTTPVPPAEATAEQQPERAAADAEGASVTAAGDPDQLGVPVAQQADDPPPERVSSPAAPLSSRAPAATGGVRASCDCGDSGKPQLVYAIGTIGFDYRTEARRDSFRQQMDRPELPAEDGTYTTGPANPYDANQLARYLAGNPWASDKVTWTLNMDRTPLYALEAEMPVGMDWGEVGTGAGWQEQVDKAVDAGGDDLKRLLGSPPAYLPVSHVYRTFRDAIVGQALPIEDDGFISRVSIPGRLTNRTVRLFSGQIVPVVEVKSRGIHTWNEPALVRAATGEVKRDARTRGMEGTIDDAMLEQNVRAFLDKIYYQFRNLGQLPADRALNYAGTNAFMVTQEIRSGMLSGNYVPRRTADGENLYTLDTITVTKSPYDRIDSDCWDVVVTFFDPENDRRAKVSYLFTIDVSDDLPVSLAPAHRFLGGI